MVQRILLLCYQYDIYLDLILIPSKKNILADAASRQNWHVFEENWLTFDLFAEYRAKHRGNASDGCIPSKMDILNPRVRQAIRETKRGAFEQSTETGAKSAWKLWVQYMADNNRDAYLELNDPDFDIFIAGFEASLCQGLYGKLKSADSIITYKSQVTWCLQQHGEHRIKQDVERGMKKQLRYNKKQVDPWRLEYFATLYENAAIADNLDQLQVLLVLSFLGFGIQRSRSAVAKSVTAFQNNSHLDITDVRLDRRLYAIWWGVKHSKGDPFAKRMGRDRKDWVPTAGVEGASHPIDIVWLLKKFCKMMGYRIDPAGKISTPQGNVPFFQQLSHGKPTGKPLTYNQLLDGMRDVQRGLTATYPNIADEHFGLHSLRRFGATLAKTRGVPDDLIQLMGRWVSLTFQRYFVFDNAELVQINRQLLQ
jgi:hypothetical protein